MIRWQREYDRTYLTIQDEHIQEDSYELKMLLSNTLPGMLPLQTKRINGELLLYFDISAKQDLEVLHSRAGIKSAELNMLLSGIHSLIGTMRSYMLSGEDLILSPSYIYMDRDLHEAAFCCIPGRSRYSLDQWKEELHTLAEFILKHLDYSDPDAVLIGYNFYHRISEDPAVFAALLEEYSKEAERKPGAQARLRTGKTGTAESIGDAGKAQSLDGSIYGQAVSSLSRDPVISADLTDLDDEGDAGFFEKRGESRKNTGRKQKSGKAAGKLTQIGSRKDRSENTSKNRDRGKDHRKGSSKKKRILIAAAVLSGAAAVDFLVIWFLALDLTSSGGVILLTLAGLWLGYRMVFPDENEPSSVWDLPDEEEEDETWLGEIPDQAIQAVQADLPSDAMRRKTPDKVSSAGENRPEGIPEIPHFLTGEIEGNRPGDFRGTEKNMAYTGKDPATRVLAGGQKESILEAEGKADDILLTGRSMILGTSPGLADHVIASDVVSRIHARMEQKEDGWMIIDLNSRNGTYVNDTRLTPNEGTLLHDGDKVVLADLRYHFREAQSQP